jgi:hypothetical protein
MAMKEKLTPFLLFWILPLIPIGILSYIYANSYDSWGWSLLDFTGVQSTIINSEILYAVVLFLAMILFFVIKKNWIGFGLLLSVITAVVIIGFSMFALV